MRRASFPKKYCRISKAVPGLKEEPSGEVKKLFEEWATDGDDLLFKSAQWWKELLEEECGDTCDISVTEAQCDNEAWEDWYLSGHEYAVRDQEYLSRGVGSNLNFVFMFVHKKV